MKQITYQEESSMENRQYDVTALGELLIDFTENGDSSQGNPTFEANPGGAPCNVLAMLNRLGKKTALIPEILSWTMKFTLPLLLYILTRTETVIFLSTVIQVQI